MKERDWDLGLGPDSAGKIAEAYSTPFALYQAQMQSVESLSKSLADLRPEGGRRLGVSKSHKLVQSLFN